MPLQLCACAEWVGPLLPSDPVSDVISIAQTDSRPSTHSVQNVCFFYSDNGTLSRTTINGVIVPNGSIVQDPEKPNALQYLLQSCSRGGGGRGKGGHVLRETTSRITRMITTTKIFLEPRKGGGSSLHSGIEFGRSRTVEGSLGGRKKGVV